MKACCCGTTCDKIDIANDIAKLEHDLDFVRALAYRAMLVVDHGQSEDMLQINSDLTQYFIENPIKG